MPVSLQSSGTRSAQTTRKAPATRTTPRRWLVASRIPDIHPNVAGIYRRKVARLADALDNPGERDEAASAIRGLIDRIVLTPGARRGEMGAALHGDLGAILEWTGNGHEKTKTDIPMSGMSVSVVAGVGFEPTTFRL